VSVLLNYFCSRGIPTPLHIAPSYAYEAELLEPLQYIRGLRSPLRIM
jgi:hypothetical protein